MPLEDIDREISIVAGGGAPVWRCCQAIDRATTVRLPLSVARPPKETVRPYGRNRCPAPVVRGTFSPGHRPRSRHGSRAERSVAVATRSAGRPRGSAPPRRGAGAPASSGQRVPPRRSRHRPATRYAGRRPAREWAGACQRRPRQAASRLASGEREGGPKRRRIRGRDSARPRGWASRRRGGRAEDAARRGPPRRRARP